MSTTGSNLWKKTNTQVDGQIIQLYKTTELDIYRVFADIYDTAFVFLFSNFFFSKITRREKIGKLFMVIYQCL